MMNFKIHTQFLGNWYQELFNKIPEFWSKLKTDKEFRESKKLKNQFWEKEIENILNGQKMFVYELNCKKLWNFHACVTNNSIEVLDFLENL